jgi:hypothetical protein
MSFLPFTFNVADWYWAIGGSTTEVYSSKHNYYVPIDDDEFDAWRNAHANMPPYNAADEAEIWPQLKEVLPWWTWDGTTFSYPGPGQYKKPQLQNYNVEKRAYEVNGGMVAAGIPVRTDESSRGLIQGSRALALADPAFNTKWYGSDGNFYDVDAPKMIAMSDAVGKHTNDCYKVFESVYDSVMVSDVTTIEQIDAAYAGL